MNRRWKKSRASPPVEQTARSAGNGLPPWFVRRILRARYDALSKIAGVTVPVLILHGDKDDVVPLDAGRRLFEAARAPKQFHVIRAPATTIPTSWAVNRISRSWRAF